MQVASMNIPVIFLGMLCVGKYFVMGQELKELRLLGLHAMTGKTWPGGGPCLVAVLMAIDEINERKDLLDGYKLTYNYIDHECIAGRAVYKMTERLYSDPPYVMVTGPVLSFIAEAVGEVSYNWNVTQLAFAASSTALSYRVRYPRFYRISPPDTAYDILRVDIARHFNWNKIATIHHALEFFSTNVDNFVDLALQHNLTIITQQVFIYDPYTQVQTLKNEDARIIFAIMYEDKARETLCAAYKIGLYGPKVVWIMYGFFSNTFWKDKLDEVDCTEEEMNAVAEGIFLIKHANNNLDEMKGVANVTHSDWLEKFHARPDYNPAAQRYDNLADNCYDGTWLVAKALNCSVNTLKEINHTKTLDQFDYTDMDIADIIFTCTGKQSIIGLTHNVSFVDGKDPVMNAQLQRIQDGERVMVAFYIRTTDGNYFDWLPGKLVWKDGKIPRDSTLVIEEELVIPLSLYLSMCVASALGILLAVCFFTFNIIYRDNRTVKMSSPNINNVLLVGCILCYFVVFIKTIEVPNAAVCKVRSFIFCLGFTITFGALFSKTWRVYRIFTNKKLLKRTIKDSQLLAIISLLGAAVLVVLVLWEAVGPHEMVIRQLNDKFYTVGNDEEIRPYIMACYSEYSSQFGWAIYVMEGALLTFGAFLAWETRHVTIAALNDSHQIGLCLYNVVVLSAVGLTLSLLLENQDVMLYGVTSACLILGTTVTQFVVFAPKVHAVISKVDLHVTNKFHKPGQSTTAMTEHSAIETKRQNGAVDGNNEERDDTEA